MDERNNYIEEMLRFTEKTKKDVGDILEDLEWTLSSISEKNNSTIVCPFDAAHRLPMHSLEKHLEACQWKAEGYTEFDIPFSTENLRLNTGSSIIIDEEMQKKILQTAKQQNPSLNVGVGEQLIPRTSNRLFSDFTSDERKVLYEYVIAHTVKPDMGQDITDLNTVKSHEKEASSMTTLELLALERNMKRRRAKHRGVHTNKKSHTEILREVINQQMEMYTEYISEKEGSLHSINQSSEETNKSRKDHTYETQLVKNVEPCKRFDQVISREREKRHHYEKFEESSIKSNSSRSRNRSREKSKHRHRSRSKHHKSHKKDRHRSEERRYERRNSHDRETSYSRKRVKYDHYDKR